MCVCACVSVCLCVCLSVCVWYSLGFRVARGVVECGAVWCGVAWCCVLMVVVCGWLGWCPSGVCVVCVPWWSVVCLVGCGGVWCVVLVCVGVCACVCVSVCSCVRVCKCIRARGRSGVELGSCARKSANPTVVHRPVVRSFLARARGQYWSHFRIMVWFVLAGFWPHFVAIVAVEGRDALSLTEWTVAHVA